MGIDPKASEDMPTLRDLSGLDILGSQPDELFEELLRWTADMLDMPTAAISLVNDEHPGHAEAEGPRLAHDSLLCAHTILREGVFEVPDIGDDPRFAHLQPSVGSIHVRAYFGVPLRSVEGHPLGTLYVVDQWPRQLDQTGRRLLETVAYQISRGLEMRAIATEAVASQKALRRAHQAQGDFLASMSHELRTPLSAIIGFAKVLKNNKQGTFGKRDLDFLGRIQNSGEHLLRLVDDILDLSKVESGRIDVDCRPFDLAHAVSSLLADLQGKSRTIPIDLRIPPRLRPAVADPHRFRQVLLNLVANALKFTKKGVVEVRIVADRERNPLRVDVTDTGTGIPPELREQIFERFEQAKGASKHPRGWGLGLFLSKKLCESMDLRLELDSKVGVGTVFSIMLDERADGPVYQTPRSLRPPESLATVTLTGLVRLRPLEGEQR